MKKLVKVIVAIVSMILSIVCIFQFMKVTPFTDITDFSNREVCYATAKGYDANKLANLYTLFLLFMICTIFLLVSFISKSKANEIKTYIYKFFYRDKSKKKCTLQWRKNARGCAFLFACLFAFFIPWLYSLSIFLYDSEAVVVSSIIMLFFLTYLSVSWKKYGVDVMMMNGVGICFFGIVIAIINEVCCIMAYKNHISGIKLRWVILISAIIYNILYLMRVFFGRKKEVAITEKMIKIFYLVSVLSIISIIYSRQLVSVLHYDYFENANHGISMMDAVLFNKIPLIDNFDAHMFSDSWLSILYYWITRDYQVALISPWKNIYVVLFYIILFLLLSKVTNEEYAFFGTILFNYDFSQTECIRIFGIGIFMFLIYEKWRENNKTRSDVLFWLLAVISVLFRLDVAVAFGIGTILAAYYVMIKEKDYNHLLRFTTVGIFFGVCCLCLLAVIVTRNDNFFRWLDCTLNVIFSNQNWAYGLSAFESAKMEYVFFPIIVVTLFASTIKILNLSKMKREIINLFILSYVLNASRTIIRHNTLENGNSVMLFLVLGIFFCIGIWIVDLQDMSIQIQECGIKAIKGSEYKNRVILYLVSGLCVSIFLFGICSMINISSRMILDNADHFTTFSGKQTYEGQEQVNELEYFFNNVLQDDETIFDYTNSTLLLALMKYRNSIYENQSPGLINGEKGQLYAIKRLSENQLQIPVILMSQDVLYEKDNLINSYDSIDFINKLDRHYLITEYIYVNYRPLCFFGGYEIWCLKDRYDEMRDTLIRMNGKYKDDMTFSTFFYAQKIPYIWANFDDIQYDSYNMKPLVNSNELYLGEVEYNEFNKEKGMYLMLTLDAAEECEDAQLVINYGEETAKYYFTILKGTNNYKIRISTNYGFYLHNKLTAELKDVTNVKIEKCGIAEGDVIQSIVE